MIKVCANVSREVANYYRGCELNDVVNTLLETFEFDKLPQMRGEREVELRLTINNEFYESMYKTYGPRSKKVSLGRLLEFGKDMDVLNSDAFKIYKADIAEPDFGLFYLNKAVRNLKKAAEFDKSEFVTSLYEGLKAYVTKKNLVHNSVYGLVNEEAQDVQNTD